MAGAGAQALAPSPGMVRTRNFPSVSSDAGGSVLDPLERECELYLARGRRPGDWRSVGDAKPGLVGGANSDVEILHPLHLCRRRSVRPGNAVRDLAWSYIYGRR